MISRSMMFAASLLLASTAGVLAQSDHDAGAPGGMTTVPPPYPSRSAEQGVPPSQNPYVPGATGRTIVQGTNSTMADDSRATVEQRTGTVATGQGGGGTGQ
jgi:hypothetical protein